MQRKFTVYLMVFMLVAGALIVGVVFVAQTYSLGQTNRQRLITELDEVCEKLNENELEIADLSENLGQSYLEKTRAFAYMIQQNPQILENRKELNKIQTMLNADVLCVTDEKGVCRWGEESYFGFDCNTTEQSAAFMGALTDKSFELVQEAMPNGSKGELIQYIGVARQDKSGLVQIGMRPERMEQALANNTIDKVLSEHDIGNSGYVMAINSTDKSLLAYKKDDLIGLDYVKAGIPQNVFDVNKDFGFTTIDNESVLYVNKEFGAMVLCAIMPCSEMYEQRNQQIIIFLISTVIIFVILLLLINFILRTQIVNKVHNITADLEKITSGNLDVVINERSNKEFNILSDSINTMVESINKNATQNEELLTKQEDVLKKVKASSALISDFSEKTLQISQSINQGSSEQASSVEQLSYNMQQLSIQVNSTADKAENMKKVSADASNKLEMGKQGITNMVEAMNDINDTSSKIVDIINTINDIAAKTNMLALNAAIEAARVGEAGRGFTVVADKIQELATKSAEAAENTSQLINNSIVSVERGVSIAQETAKNISGIIEDTQTTADFMNEFAGVARRQAGDIEQATHGIQHISEVVDNNVTISSESETTSEKLAEQARMLKEIVKSKV